MYNATLRPRIIEFDEAQTPWKELGRVPALEVSAEGVKWSSTLDPPDRLSPPVGE